METKSGFTKMSVAEFETWLSSKKVARTINVIQQHHTFSPSYALFKGDNHFKLQSAMKNYHVQTKDWSDIGQHFSIFPDGSVVTGRSLEKAPACIYGQNHGICIENVGNFDTSGDTMTEEQKHAIVKVTALLCNKFKVKRDEFGIVYHHWFTAGGTRTMGMVSPVKSCPGTNFFGGNKLTPFKTIFLPLVEEQYNLLQAPISAPSIEKIVAVKTKTLNIRNGASADATRITSRPPALIGAILRVYRTKNGWLKISSSEEHWVNSKFTVDVKKGTINEDDSKVREGAGKNFLEIRSLNKGEVIYIEKTEGSWSKLVLTDEWVSNSLINLDA